MQKHTYSRQKLSSYTFGNVGWNNRSKTVESLQGNPKPYSAGSRFYCKFSTMSSKEASTDNTVMVIRRLPLFQKQELNLGLSLNYPASISHLFYPLKPGKTCSCVFNRNTDSAFWLFFGILSWNNWITLGEFWLSVDKRNKKLVYLTWNSSTHIPPEIPGSSLHHIYNSLQDKFLNGIMPHFPCLLFCRLRGDAWVMDNACEVSRKYSRKRQCKA